MRFGIFVFDSARNMDPATLAKRAEELGFSSFWIPEHTVLPVNPSKGPSGSTTAEFPESFYHISDPVISLARASGATSTIKLGTGILPGRRAEPAAHVEKPGHPGPAFRRAAAGGHRHGLVP